MIGLIQRVSHASVVVAKNKIGAIEQGILALIGIEKTDNLESGKKLINRILSYRIFEDEAHKMNLSLTDISGGLLLVPQFTLVADTKKGTRPGFSKGMPPSEGQALFEEIVSYAHTQHATIATGQFGADMQVNLCNDGPVTFSLQT